MIEGAATLADRLADLKRQDYRLQRCDNAYEISGRAARIHQEIRQIELKLRAPEKMR
jgi:hypothetical protein